MSSNISRFLRQVRHSKSNITRNWPRRAGKSYTLKLVRKNFKKEAQLFGVRDEIRIKKSTKMVLLDDYSDKRVKEISKKYPDVRIIALRTEVPGKNIVDKMSDMTVK